MKIFAILPPVPNAILDKKVQEEFAGNNIKLSANQWLVAGNGTAIDVSHQLGLTVVRDGQNALGETGTAVVLAMASYFGSAPTNIWDWVKTKLEAAS
jgi:hypothetical protein